MTMTPNLRKFALTAPVDNHFGASGAVRIDLRSHHCDVVRACFRFQSTKPSREPTRFCIVYAESLYSGYERYSKRNSAGDASCIACYRGV